MVHSPSHTAPPTSQPTPPLPPNHPTAPPQLRTIAPEYYDSLYAHTSWCWVLWRFLVDPSMGPWSRMHRVLREGTPAANARFTAGLCKLATDAAPSEAQQSSDVLLAGGAAALQSTLGGKGAARARLAHASDENNPNNYPQ